MINSYFPKVGCTDSDNGKKDKDGDGCNRYKDVWCGIYDDNDFNSRSMCCVCGGGKIGKCYSLHNC